MAGRGRPRSTLTFNAEILGVTREQPAPSSVLDPPPLYPPLCAKPKVPPNRSENIYLNSLAKDFVSRMQDSPYYVCPMLQQNTTEDPFLTLGLDERRFPFELVNVFKKSTTKGTKRKSKGTPNLRNKRAKTDITGDINGHLDKLEAKERKVGEDDNENKESKSKDPEKDNEGDIDEDDLEEIDDEEMDDETDYARDYFDNGEGYLDEEDDNLDEGGIY